jgi:anaerobic magnesium-protoporphyrin IX monomethyl ester cyclase
MKILFLEIDTERTWALASVGPGYIASYIRQHGHQAAMLRVRPEQTAADIMGIVEGEAPDILGFSLTTRQWQRAAQIAGKIREQLNIPAITGGLHPTFVPESVLNSAGFDCICLGEGEAPVGELLSHLENGGMISDCRIDNIWVKAADRPQIRPPLQSLNRLPFMARDLLDEQHGVFHVSTQRGCPFHCTFCAASAINDLYENERYRRRRSVENVIKELRQLKQENTINYIIFLDDTFTVNKSWIKNFCRVYGKHIGTGFSINARVEAVDREMLGELSEAGCKHIIYGVESGSMRVRRDILNRPVETRRIVDVFNWTKQSGVMVTANYMMGLPGETADDIEETIALNEELEPEDFGYFVFYPYPGTRLFGLCRQEGYLPVNWLGLQVNNRESILNLPDLTKDNIEHFYDRFSKIRERNYMNRYGSLLSEEGKALSRKSFAEIAAAG